MILVGNGVFGKIAFYSEDLNYVDVSVDCRKFDLLSRIKFYFMDNHIEVNLQPEDKVCVAFSDVVQKKGYQERQLIEQLVEELTMTLLSLRSNPLVAQKYNFRMRLEDYILSCIETL